MTAKTFGWSLTAYQNWQRCEQRYYYRYVRKLEQLVKDVAPERGTIIHSYLETYYSELKKGTSSTMAHVEARKVVLAQEAPLKVAAAAAFYAGREDDALAYQSMLDAILDITDRYYEVRGREDAETLDIVLVEERLFAPIAAGVTSESRIDLVARDKTTKRMSLWENKSTRSVPDSRIRVRDLQTLLYVETLKRLNRNIQIDTILWNYIRTELPDQPHKNKNGKFSKAQSVDTTWPIYEAAVIADGQDPEEYADVRERLLDRELTAFYPRYEHVIMADAKLLLTDYVREAQRARYAVEVKWKTGNEAPIRTITRDCDFCPFFRVCETVIMGGDEEEIIQLRFAQRGPRNG